MCTKRSAGPGVTAAAHENDRSAVKPKKARSANLCAFTFGDGRQCRIPHCSGHLHLCYFHAQKEAESLAAQQVGQDISRFLPVKLLTPCDLGAAMSRLFCAVARGEVKPKVASTLAYLAQTMLQSIPSPSTNTSSPSTPILGAAPSVLRSAMKTLMTLTTRTTLTTPPTPLDFENHREN
jgi:hypothetical protein